jgi:hypothetical protein
MQQLAFQVEEETTVRYFDVCPRDAQMVDKALSRRKRWSPF